MKNVFFRSALAMAVGALFNCLGIASAQVDGHGPERVTEPGPPQVIHRVNPHDMGMSAPPAGATSSTSPILYHGGPVMSTPNIYLIWYGNWNQSNSSDTPAGQQIVRDFVTNIGGSPYFSINTSYPSVTGAVGLIMETTDAYSFGSRLSDANVQSVVKNAIDSGRLPSDVNGVYFVLTSSDVSEKSGFCTRYCGWHTATSTNGGIRRYAFVGNANRCLSSCAIQSVGPNGNAGVDGMISVIAHELEEMATDPNLNAWYDASGAENADKCAWTFGHSQYQVANKAYANMRLGARDFEIQRNLLHGSNGDYCMTDMSHN